MSDEETEESEQIEESPQGREVEPVPLPVMDVDGEEDVLGEDRDVLHGEVSTGLAEARDTGAKKDYKTILEEQILEGYEELNREATGLLLSGVSAGLDLGFTLFAVAIVTQMYADAPHSPEARLMVAAAYPLGYVFVILGRSELFTEHTTLAVLPVLNGTVGIERLARLWALVFVGNIIGAAIFAFGAGFIGPRLGLFDIETIDTIARRLVDHKWWMIGLSGLLAGWMMALLSWLVTATRDTISQILLVFLVTGAIGLGHLHHCVAGTAEVLASVFCGGTVTMAGFSKFLVWTTLGNAVGGVIFVALLKWGHVSRSSTLHSVTSDDS
jgi:formate/nitrite transporter FocA (FNT family)